MIPIAEPKFKGAELKNVAKALRSGWISSQGAFIPEFENAFSRYCGTKYGVATSSGTTALHLALTALKIGRGDEVILPALTFVATANAVSYTGATPVFVDAHPDYWCMDPDKIEKKITKKTKLLIPVHLYGHPCDMQPIMGLARKYNLSVMEDAAEAHGAHYRSRKVGTFGEISCFSFYANKIITTGEGGMCLTNNRRLYETLKTLRDHGASSKKRYWYEVIGFNYRLTNLQAAVGLAQLNRIDYFIKKKRAIARWYARELKDLEEDGFMKLHPEMKWAKCVFWLCSIVLSNKCRITRDALIKELQAKGIETRPFFNPMHIVPIYKKAKALHLPVAEALGKRGLSLPSSVKLGKEEIHFISREIKNALGYAGF